MVLCGDEKIVLGQEQCDDGNAVSFDGCSNDCQLEGEEKGSSVRILATMLVFGGLSAASLKVLPLLSKVFSSRQSRIGSRSVSIYPNLP
jgi:cysteine-rich repeat protein